MLIVYNGVQYVHDFTGSMRGQKGFEGYSHGICVGITSGNQTTHQEEKEAKIKEE